MSRVDLKVVLLGSENVGKTSLLERYVYGRFRGHFPYQNVSNSNLMTCHLFTYSFVLKKCTNRVKQ